MSSNTKNQAVVQDGRVDNAGYGGNVKKNVGQNMNQMFNVGNGSNESNQIVQRMSRTDSTPNKANVQCYNYNEKGHYARDSYDNTKNVPSYDAKAVSEVNASSMVHEQVIHVKRKTIIQTTNVDQIDYSIIFDDPFVENNGGMSKHDSIAHEEYHEIQMLAYTVQRKAEKQKHLNNELKKQKDLLQQELEMFKDRIKTFESQIVQCSKYKETCDDLKCIVDLEEKLSSHDRIVYKMGQSLQTIHMLEKKPNKIYDPFLKAGLGYQNPKRLKKAIASQPKMYDGDMLHSEKLIINSTDSEETLEDAEESRIKMRNKMIQINYNKINALYDTFIPQQEFSADQTYFSIPSTSNNSSKSKDVPSESPVLKIPNESRLLKMIDKLGDAITGLHTRINTTLLKDAERRWLSDSQNELMEFYKTNVILMSRSLYKNLKDIKEELIEEVQEMLNIFESMEQKVNEKSPTEILLQKEIDRLLEVSLTSEIRNCVSLSAIQQKHDLLKDELEKTSSDSKEIQANLLNRIKILENDFQRSQAQSQVESVVQERENIKLEFQKLFNSIKVTRAQHQKEVDELLQCVTQKTYAYGEVRAENQDLLMTISELKSKLCTIEKGKNVNTKFDSSETLGKH
ncbi:hypothetical protein Tco_0887391, partial [Tanacetum coccineum]